uniref:Ovule protein n=1 Tax=Heterorhabditis bacteriophora TaxID=37862 RepID=A0A1I7XI05_HETBA
MSPIGPLRKVQEKAGDYSQDILRFMMFTASNDITTSSKDLSIKQCDTESEAENDSDSYCEMTFEEKSLGNMAWEPRIVRRYAGLREPISTNKEFENQVSSSSDVKKFTSMNGQDDSILYTNSAASALNDSGELAKK